MAQFDTTAEEITQQSMVTSSTDDPISLPTIGDGLPAISLPAQPLPPPIQPSQDTVDKRTFKSVYGGIADLVEMPEELIKSSLASGQEDWIRQEAAAKIDTNNAQKKHEKIVAASITKGGPLDFAEVKQILDPFNPVNRLSDPNSVIEKAYASNYISAVNTAASYMPDN